MTKRYILRKTDKKRYKIFKKVKKVKKDNECNAFCNDAFHIIQT